MNRARTLFVACIWTLIAMSLPPLSPALGQGSPGLRLTCLNRDEAISRHDSYPITWEAENVPPNTMLSIRLNWTAQGAERSWLIGGLLDSATQKRLPARSAAQSSTIESGHYSWDVDKFCSANKQAGKSICDGNAHYQLQLILRSASDPCADNVHCGTPRSLFKVYTSDGAFSFRD